MTRLRRPKKWRRSYQKALEEMEWGNDLSSSDPMVLEISTDLKENESILRMRFQNCSDVVFRPIQIEGQTQVLFIYIDGLIDSKVLDESVLKPFIYHGVPKGLDQMVQLGQMLEDQLIAVAQTKTVWGMEEVVRAIVNANVVVLAKGQTCALITDMKGAASRSIQEPATEPVIRGPRDGFTETLRTNTSLLRRRLKSPRMKMESLQLGAISQTDVVITYIEGIVNSSVLDEVRERVKRIEIDGILESNYIEELIEDTSYSPFPTIQHTERPDVVAGSLLEGKVGILCDGTPFALIVPFTFFAGLQAAEDYYQGFIYTTAIRWIRFILFNAALFFPSLYVAITTFHPQMIPTSLLLSFAAAREPSPFPTLVEALIMEIVFEALREAGVRLPKPVGSAVSIVGALVIGESAVRAGIVSAPIVIVVAGTGIASFAIPRYNLGIAYRLLRFPLLILAGTLGLFGIAMGAMALLLHLVSLRSFGIPYMAPLAPFNMKEIKDTLWRAPLWMLELRPRFIAGPRSIRIPKGQKPNPRR
ncbi:spore germination protein [Ammoniphilus sp. 3BR4]|uniref:spore germination protein n=1 Tax=Ammoniphilus sp. 3BR4 TaxID=3158265 RepID=UPI0034662EF5